MYHSHFGLNQAPFKITPNTEFFFSGGNRGSILEALIYAISHGEGIVKVTGEVGSGKTMLCSMLQTRVPGHIETVYLANPSVSPDEILHAIAFELQLGVESGTSRLEVMHALQEYLLKRHAEGKRVVVFIEESQGMPLATLEEIRLLSNLETHSDKLLQMVLFGQPELDVNLREPRIRQLRERITHSFRLDPLEPEEIGEYLMFRMRAAGYRGPDLFSSSVVKAIARASAGLTRRVNIIADKALLAAFSENTHAIKVKHVAEAVRDSEFSQNPPERAGLPRWAIAAVLVAAGAVAGAAIYAVTRSPGERAGPADAVLAPASRAPEAPAPTAEPEPATSPGSSLPAAPAPADAASPPAQVEPGATPKSDDSIKSIASDRVSASGRDQPALPSPTTQLPATGAEAPAPARTEAATARDAPQPAEGDLLAQRLAATTDWLAREAEGTYSIQLLGTGNEAQLKHRLNDIMKFIEINDVFVYRTRAKGQPSLTLLYGRFSDRKAARDALSRLPAFLKVYDPILRTVRGIRTELQQVRGS